MRRITLTTNAQAILWVTLGTALFSLLYASAKFGAGAASVFQILLLRYVSGLVSLLVVAAAKRRPLRTYRSERPFSHLLRAVFGVSGGLSLIHASAAMPIVDATAIGLLYVVFVIPLGVLVLKETVGLRHGVGIALCCLGAAVVVGSRGVFTSFEPAYLRPAGIAVVGAALLAIEGLMIRVLANADRPLTVLLHVNVFGIFLMAVPAALAWQPISVANAAPFLLLGPIVVMAQYCIV
ncbi:MAG: EamA family transporter, partial [Methylobacterium sp.]